MEDCFDQARHKLLSDISCPIVSSRLSTVTVAITDAADMAKNINGDNYRRYLHIPAYYDPNDHRVFLNRQALDRSSRITSFIICYHELVHSASTHKNYRNYNGSQVFQSGIKIERYSRGSYRCYNRLFNEGLVQFFTTHFNQVRSSEYGYAREVRLVEMIAEKIGIEPLRNALFYGAYDELVTDFEAHYGRGSFARFSRIVDKRNYEQAESILLYADQITTLGTLAPAYIH